MSSNFISDEGLLRDLLVFLTGADEIPLLGFQPEPELTFGHLDQFPIDCPTREYPVANTCGLQLRLPILPTYDIFKCRVEATVHAFTTFTAV